MPHRATTKTHRGNKNTGNFHCLSQLLPPLTFSLIAGPILIGSRPPFFPWNRAAETIPTVPAASRYDKNPWRGTEHGPISLPQPIMASPSLFPDSGPNTNQIQASFFPLEPRRRDDSNGPCRIALRQKPVEGHRTRPHFTTSANYGLPLPFP